MLKKNDIITSVIIPVYNEEKYLDKCLRSFQNQTFSNFEIIIIDDGSTDRTREIASKYNVKLHTISHGGPGSARNFGVKNSVGKILVFLDADMYIDKNYINNLIRPILFGKCSGTYSTTEYVGNMDNLWAKCWNITHDILSDKRVNIEENLNNQVFRAILRDKFVSLKGFDPSLGYYDDHSLGRMGFKVTSVNNAICYHNNPSTLTEVFFSARWIGRSIEFRPTFTNILKYSVFNSLKISINKIIQGAPFVFVFFKIIFDLGILTGMLFKNTKQNYAK